MERMLVVVFDEERRAAEAGAALRRIERKGRIAIYSGAIVVKHTDGTASVEEFHDFPLAALFGTSAGSLIGLVGGPAGFAVGAMSGLVLGRLYALDAARVGEDFVSDVSKFLTPNKAALVAEIDEDATGPVDECMEAMGGRVFRRALWEVRDPLTSAEMAALEEEIAQLEAELRLAAGERRARLQENLDLLEAKRDAKKSTAEERRAAFAQRQHARKQTLRKNAAAAARALRELARTPL